MAFKISEGSCFLTLFCSSTAVHSFHSFLKTVIRKIKMENFKYLNVQGDYIEKLKKGVKGIIGV